MSIKTRLRLLLLKNRIKAQRYDSCFGPYPEKYQELFKWLDYGIKAEGDIAEFGVASGGTTCLMAERLLSHQSSKIMHSFDSFSGFPDEEFDNQFARGNIANSGERMAFRGPECSLPYVQAKLKVFGFHGIAQLHPGIFQKTLPAFFYQSPSLCFALIDCDLAPSVSLCAEWTREHLTPGGVLVFDDYGSLVSGKPDTAYSIGVRKAVDSFVLKYPSDEHGYANGLYHWVKPGSEV